VITDVAGLRVGHWTDPVAATGCTVVLFPEGTVASGEVRGGAPATRETALLDPTRTVARLDALVLTGGSAFGLAAADGAVRFCEERGIGFVTPAGPVPIVVALGLFDLMVGDPAVRPGPDEGYAACVAATAGPVEVGRVGAGTGATVGTLTAGPGVAEPGADGSPGAAAEPGADGSLGAAAEPGADGSLGAAAEPGAAGLGAATAPGAAGPRRRPGGLVTAGARAGDLVVTALVAVNAAGEPGADDAAALVAAPSPGAALAGPAVGGAGTRAGEGGITNTTIGLVATNAHLDKVACHLVAQGAHDGLARAVFPAHTRGDGDAFVAAAVGDVAAEVDVVRNLAVHVVARAVGSLASG
jgi:L-aminopeptidase/D-esterase-like protein